MGAGARAIPRRDEIVAYYDSDNDFFDSAEDYEEIDDENVNENQTNVNIPQGNEEKPLLIAVCNIHKTFMLSIPLYSAIIDSLRNDKSMDVPNVNLFDVLFYLGALLGVLITVPLKPHNMSRKLMISLSVIISLIGWLSMLFARTYIALAFCRCIIGLAMGLYSVSFCFYIRESFASLEIINLALSRTNYGFLIGILLTFFAGRAAHWREVILMGITLHIYVILTCLPEIPKSTYLLLRKGEDALAQQSLERIIKMNNLPPRNYFINIKAIVQEAILYEDHDWRLNITTLIHIFLFVFSEASEVLIYCCLITMKEFSLYYLLLTLVCFIIIDYMRSSKLFEPNKIIIFTLLKGLIMCSMYNFVYAANQLVQDYFILLYAGGWLTGYHKLFRIKPYYLMLPLVPLAFFLKYLLALIISVTCDSFFSNSNNFPTAYSVVIILISLYL